jgi:4-hydroxybenzoate polyprenyltransferase
MRTPAAIRLLRPSQWLKNGFVIAPLIFSRSFLAEGAVMRAMAALAIFCGAASAGYIINDIIDRESDRAHPLKRVRPIASGEISVSLAWTIVAMAIPLLLLVSFFIAPKFLLAVALYLGLTTAYSVRLKSMPIVDLFAIACGFVLRVWGGAVAINVVLSVWMFITTLSLALYLAATKRRQELLTTTSAAEFRAVLQHYSVALMDYYSEIAIVATFVFYGLYIATVRPQLAATVPVVLFAVFRYRYLMELTSVEGIAESPTDRLVRDPQMLLCGLLWAAISVLVLYFEPR